MAAHCWRMVSQPRSVPRHDGVYLTCPAALLRRVRAGGILSGIEAACLRRGLCVSGALSSPNRGDGLPDDNVPRVGKAQNAADKSGTQASRRRTNNSPRNLSPSEALAGQRSAANMENSQLLARTGSYSAREGLRSSPSSSEQQQEPSPPPGFKWEYLVALCTLGVVICYADRSNISTAVLPMAQQFGWDKAYQGVVLSVFFGGYATTQILGGKLADQYGGKMVLAAGVALWSLFTYATPAAAAAGTLPLLVARVMLGVGEGVAFPSIHSLIARNVPVRSQTTAVGIVTAASYAGTALAFGISPLIISKFGWEWVFYAFSGLALLWLPLWLPVKTLDKFKAAQAQAAAEAAADAAAAAAADSDGAIARTSGGGGVAAAAADPWALLRRREVWAICAAQYAQSWGMYGLLNWLPTFFSEYYAVQLADLGSYTLLPYVFQGGLGAATGVMADYMIRSGWRVGTVRKLLQIVGMLGPAACLCLAVSPLVGASASLASGLITVGLGFSALTLGGVSASHLDVAPRNAGLVFGAGNTAATLAGLVSVPVTGYVLQTTGSWPLVFGITAFHYVAGALMWALWAGDRPLPEDGGGGAAAGDGGSGGSASDGEGEGKGHSH
ncbi:hypothetical protein PLESTB_000705400 [Pleodorina starrii]|uniref:Major facilitator superfamily (MFS) profile domain-containing protein n=1 Tax=Pleodorina starrii TaxID=330485 RepID=A0A9W6B9H8_9CHLO|nr:hypothetical protein PLESTM_001083000 [Pleodorina starrii]GLC48018.1 hypothetical protein PLESTB_000050000 [Pleodorina starrii]GLC53078.1 hypothetical protein PLESTB_000705400 [Pleodorina starrii]